VKCSYFNYFCISKIDFFRAMARGKKTGGRVKGSVNKTTVQQKERAEKLMQLLETKYLATDIKKLSPAQRMQLYIATMEYVAPKLSRVDAKIKGNVDLTNAVIKFK
jgi:hypothetical protein